jgi:aryl-phospho-beta-D-glucosidase BglC (GH1 family)
MSSSRLAIVALIIIVVAALAVLISYPLINKSNTSSTTFISTAGSSYFATTSGSTAVSGLCNIPPCSEPITGWLHTTGRDTKVYDSEGNSIRLVGLDVIGLEFGTGTSTLDACNYGWGGQNAGGYSTSEFDDIASWGFNSVRLPISWENMEPNPPTLAQNGSWVHHWNTAYLNEIDYFVNQFSQRHIGVIIDFAQVGLSSAFKQVPGGAGGFASFCEGWGEPTWLYPGPVSATTGEPVATAICNFFTDQSAVGNNAPSPIEGMEAAEQMIASRYANNPAVIGLDIFNEPWFPRTCGTLASQASLLAKYDAVMSQAIATVNPHILIIFEDVSPNIMPGGTSPILTSPPSVPNTVYELHVYIGSWLAAQPLLDAYLNNAEKWQVPLYMGEFDAFYAGSAAPLAKVDPNWQADTVSLLNYCKTNGINWSFFSYTSLGTNVHTPEPKTQVLAILREGI